MAMATIHVRVHGTFRAPTARRAAAAPFPPDNAPTCTPTNITPQIFYPNDGVLLPPNMEVVAVHFTPFPAGPPALPIQEFEIDFANANTDVRVSPSARRSSWTRRTPPAATGGCEFKLDPTVWDFIAKSNRGGDAVKITVRATTDGMCATPSMNSVNMAFAEQDVNGGIFYWKSSITAGGVGGNIWAKAFGNAIPEEQITGVAGTNLANATCFGCHALSRDGKRMVVNFDDDDSDDEYGDVVHTLMDVGDEELARRPHHVRPLPAGLPGDRARRHASTSPPTATASAPTNTFFMYDAMTGMALAPATPTIGPAMVGTAPARPTHARLGARRQVADLRAARSRRPWDGTSRNDDNHVFGGSIMSATYDPAAMTFGTPTAIVTSAGENNFYPGYSPDGSFIVFNRVPQQPVTNADRRIARLHAAPAAGAPARTTASPIRRRASCCSRRRRARCRSTPRTPTARRRPSPVDVSNSWPRWSPFIQTYKGDKLLWVTFSSTRDYGLRVRNHKAGMFQCYPADSLEQPGAAHGQSRSPPTASSRRSGWRRSTCRTSSSTATDPSFVAFWLPFQDDTTAQPHRAVDRRPSSISRRRTWRTCIPSGGMCTPGGTPCCSGGCFGGVCGIP